MKKLIVSVALAGLSVLAWALPTLQQVEAEVGRGNYAQAESMMREVVAAKPGSARAHYIYAEILAHQGKLALAAEEAKQARTIDPDVKFTTDPEKFRTFEATLLRAQSPAARTQVTCGHLLSRAFSRAMRTASGSMSLASTGQRSALAAAMASTPVPVPTSSTRRGLFILASPSSASRQPRVVP